MSLPGRLRGMTLVAFMVALALGALLLLLAAELLLASRRSLVWQAAVTQLERAGERGLSLVSTDLRMAGFLGGVRSVSLPAGAPGCGGPDGWALGPFPALAFADRGATDDHRLSDGSMPACLPLRYLQPGSDLLALKRAATLETGAGGRAVRETQWYLLADTQGRGTFDYVGLATGALASGDRQLREWRTAIYYVRDYSTEAGDGIPALCVERLQGSAMRSECLVEGVERLHVEFHCDRDADGRPDEVLAAPSAADLRRATHATVYLQVRTLAHFRPRQERSELRFGREGVVIPAGDPYLHRVFVRTVPLRNLPWSGV